MLNANKNVNGRALHSTSSSYPSVSLSRCSISPTIFCCCCFCCCCFCCCCLLLLAAACCYCCCLLLLLLLAAACCCLLLLAAAACCCYQFFSWRTFFARPSLIWRETKKAEKLIKHTAAYSIYVSGNVW